jgi:hypothetical protein
VQSVPFPARAGYGALLGGYRANCRRQFPFLVQPGPCQRSNDELDERYDRRDHQQPRREEAQGIIAKIREKHGNSPCDQSSADCGIRAWAVACSDNWILGLSLGQVQHGLGHECWVSESSGDVGRGFCNVRSPKFGLQCAQNYHRHIWVYSRKGGTRLCQDHPIVRCS